MRHLLLFILISSIASTVSSQNYSVIASVQLWTEISENPPSIKLNWVKDPNATLHYIYRKTKESKTWGGILATLPKDSVSFTDKNIKIGETYEYRVSRTSAVLAGTGYVFAGIKAKPIHWRGSILLLVDSTVASRLKNEVDIWKNDVMNEGWNVITYIPQTKNSVVQIKNKIKEIKTSNPDLRSVFILGHVKVPYSGNIAPDGHTPDHVGAWPADTYYADLDDNWTDESVSNSTAGRNENRNEPGDGKFDQLTIPTDVELEIGRVDFFNLPAFSLNEIELLRRYLNKNHKFRISEFKPENRSVVYDDFNRTEAFGQSGFKNFSAFFGPNNIHWGGYRDSLLKKSYLWSYGAGGGWYEGASNVSTTQNMAVDSLQGVFTFLFGSYFGDWDSPNNFLRAALASGSILTNAWAGRPVWYVHHMAIGETIGYGAKLSTNNATTYFTGNEARGVHIALMGDPSLTLLAVKAPSKLEAVESGSNIDLKWEASTEATDGYNIYRKIRGNTIYDLLASNVTELKYKDRCPVKGFSYDYMVRAVKLETNASGSFYNLSPGSRDTITPVIVTSPIADFTYNTDFEFIKLKSNSKNANTFKWIIGRDTFTSVELDVQLSCDSLNHNICLIAENECESDLICKNISITCSAPLINLVSIDSVKCFGGLGSISIDDVLGADPFTYMWSNGSTGSKLVNVVSGTYTLTITSAKSTSNSFQFNLTQPANIDITFKIKPSAPTKNNGGLDSISISGGTAPYSYRLLPAGRIDSLPAGNYTLTLTDAKGCNKEISFTVPINTDVTSVYDKGNTVYPVPSKDYILIQFAEGLASTILNIYNVEGILVKKLKYKSGEPIYIGDLLPGQYYIEAKFNSYSKVLKFHKI